MLNRNLFAIAGLLHDIGKFGQRADGNYRDSQSLDNQSKELADKICPSTKSGFFTHQHVIWTNNFLEKFKSKFVSANLYGEGENNMFNLACYHHKPSTIEHAIITLADHWSSGIDRNTEMVSNRIEKEGRYKFRTQPIVSIFNELKTEVNPKGIGGKYGHPVQALSISEKSFPVEIASLDIQQQYENLYKLFEAAFSKVESTSKSGLIESLYNLLRLYTSYIPASTMDYPDSSLFEHMKITGAFADCISEYYNENPSSLQFENGSRIKVSDDHYPVIMLCGDISGIQSFIYSISNKSAMKGLKGRSFYIQIMAEAYMRKLLNESGATQINSIYSAGGKFYILLPNTHKTRELIDKVQKDIQSALWNEYKGKLNLNIGYIPFRLENVQGQLKVAADGIESNLEIGELWRLLAEKTTEAKKNRFDEILRTRFEEMFEPFGSGGEMARCSVTGEELEEGYVQLEKEDIEQGDLTNVVSSKVFEQIKIGSSLYNADYLVQYTDGRKDGFQVPSVGYWDLKNSKDHFHSIDSIIKIAFEENEPNLKTVPSIEKNAGIGFRFYGGSKMVQNGHRPATLEELCINSEGKIDKLGILRMDVDNLGQLFMNGFNKETASFSKLATMSSQLDQFFSGYINTLLKGNKYSKNVNVIYSGGDDLFAVGRWDSLFEFSIDIRKNFKKFVCNRTDITLSAGIAIVGSKFPISKAAQDAEVAEKKAKNHEINGLAKDSLNVFGISLNWQEEMPFVITFKDDLLKWINHDKIISKGLMMKIFDYYESYKSGKNEWRWQSAYTMSRFSKESQSSNSKQAVEKIKTLLFTGNYNNTHTNIRFEAIIAACRWAELLIKQ